MSAPVTPGQSGTWVAIAGPGVPGLALDPAKPVIVRAMRCVCPTYSDGSVYTGICPLHAHTDPCLTMALVTGRRRKGTIRRGVCTACGHDSRVTR